MHRRFLVVIALVALGGGCGIPDDEGPVALDAAQLPPDPVPAEAGAGGEDDVERSVLYLVAGERLQPVQRPAQPSLAATLDALLEGPRETEAALGLRTAIPAGTRVLGVTLDGTTLRVDLSEEFISIVGEEHLLALAQLVYTAAAASPVDQVQVAIEGEAVAVAKGDGQLTSEPVRPADYDALAPA
ncbi:MAG: GerMN domain-containing protein [Actinobacteria bacterium]|nr:GerMN domain-containing protein [Actinomycetota bacterium]